MLNTKTVITLPKKSVTTMKNTIFSTSLLLLCLCTTGCFDVVEEIWLNQDQSGRYAYTLDMSDAVKTMGGMVKDLAGDGQTNMEASVQDTTFYLSQMPDSTKQKFSNPALFDRIKVHSHTDMAQQKSYMTYTLEFNNLSEITEFWTMMPQIKAMIERKSQTNLIGIPPVYSFEANTFKRVNVALNENDQKDVQEQMSNPFMVSMFKDASQKVIVHLPASATAATGATISNHGKVVETNIPFMDLIAKPEALNFNIKF